MAESKKITIVLTTKDNGGKGDEEEDEAGKETPEQVYQREHKQAIMSALNKSAEWTSQQIEAQVNYMVGTYSSLTENYKTEIWVSNVSTTVAKAKGLVSSTLTMAKLGTAIAPGVGTAVGAAVGIVAYTASNALDLGRQYLTQSIGLETGDINASFAASRLGLVDGGRGTQN